MKSKVYFSKIRENSTVEEQTEAMKKLCELDDMRTAVSGKGFAAVKIHIGEKLNVTHIKPEVVKAVTDKVKSFGPYTFLTETSTLYTGERENAVKHLMLVQAHGFGADKMGVPFIMADGLVGKNEKTAAINGEINKEVFISEELHSIDSLIVISHPTGHIVTGLGATIKNIGMGLASRKGKLRQHSSLKPSVDLVKCRFCKKCIKSCPENAIIEKDNKALIITEKCIGCGECLVECLFDAIVYDFKVDSYKVQKNMAEHAWGIVKNIKNKCFYFNVMASMTKDCDCYGVAQEKIIPDIGILASNDPVAVDKAVLDITAEKNGQNLSKLSYPENDPMIQLLHAEKLGMGSIDYELISVQ